MSLRRSSCRIRSWLVRDGNVKTGPPRLSLPPGENNNARVIKKVDRKEKTKTLNQLAENEIGFISHDPNIKGFASNHTLYFGAHLPVT